MNKFMQHIPNFIEVNKRPKQIEFKAVGDLLKLEIVQRYGKNKDFSHFAIKGNCLMAISNNGFYWWVVGYIKDPSTVDLPQWEGRKYRAELSDSSVVILTDEVVSSCGDILTLRNGTKVKNLEG